MGGWGGGATHETTLNGLVNTYCATDDGKLNANLKRHRKLDFYPRLF